MDKLDSLKSQITEHVDFVNFDSESSSLEVCFNLGPVDWKPGNKLVFSNVSDFYQEILDDEDQPGKDNFTDLVLEFSESNNSYYLHLTTVAFSFKSNQVKVCAATV